MYSTTSRQTHRDQSEALGNGKAGSGATDPGGGRDADDSSGGEGRDRPNYDTFQLHIQQHHADDVGTEMAIWRSC